MILLQEIHQLALIVVSQAKCNWSVNYSEGLQSLLLKVNYQKRLISKFGNVLHNLLLCMFFCSSAKKEDILHEIKNSTTASDLWKQWPKNVQ